MTESREFESQFGVTRDEAQSLPRVLRDQGFPCNGVMNGVLSFDPGIEFDVDACAEVLKRTRDIAVKPDVHVGRSNRKKGSG